MNEKVKLTNDLVVSSIVVFEFVMLFIDFKLILLSKQI